MVDDPSRGPAPEVQGGRPLQHLYGLDIENIAKVGPLVAYAVEKEVIAGVEATQGEVVSLRTTSLARLKADAGDIPERVPEVGDALFLDEFLGDDGDLLRNISNRLRKPRQP